MSEVGEVGLLSLPNELLARVCELAWRMEDVVALSQTCRILRWLVEEVFRRWDLVEQDRRAWMCLVRPEEVEAHKVEERNEWWGWWKAVCVTGTWELLDWLGEQCGDGWEVFFRVHVWKHSHACAKREDGVRGLAWLVERFDVKPTRTRIGGIAREAWASRVLAFIHDDLGGDIHVQRCLSFARHESTVAFLVERGAILVSEEGLQACAAIGDRDGLARILASEVMALSREQRLAGALRYARDSETVRMLMEAGADPNTRAAVDPFCMAAGEGRVSAMEALRDCGVDVHALASALGRAAAHGCVETVAKLLEWGFDAGQQTREGVTPLHEAVLAAPTRARIACVRLLLEHGGDPEAEAEDGESVRDWAVHKGWGDQLVRALFPSQ